MRPVATLGCVDERVGFAGIGVMGRPMAEHLARAGVPLVVWNRTRDKTAPLAELGAEVAENLDELFDRTRIVLLMLADGAAVDAVLDRRGDRFRERVAGHTIVPMGTTDADYSAGLAGDVVAAGGRYVEAPVSGSRVPAETGRLVAMLAGDAVDVEEIASLIEPMCARIVPCGPVPNALGTKLAVNLYLIAGVAALAESYHFAVASGLDLDAFRSVLDGGQLASDVSRVKLGKLLAGDFAVQASVRDVHYNARLLVERTHELGIASPLLDVSRALFAETEALGLGGEDMAAVVRAIEARTRNAKRPAPESGAGLR